MKLQDISGKKIVGIREVRDQKSSGKWDRFVDALVLEDGTELRPIACELEHGDGYGVQFVVVKIVAKYGPGEVAK